MQFNISQRTEGFQVNAVIRRRLAARRRRIAKRLDKTEMGTECPVISASNIQYEIADRTKAVAAGGIGLIHNIVKELEFDVALNQLGLFKIYLPYSESDHVLNIAYNLPGWPSHGPSHLGFRRFSKVRNRFRQNQ